MVEIKDGFENYQNWKIPKNYLKWNQNGILTEN